MDTDLALITGIFLVILAIPSALSALIDGRAPRVAAIVVLIGGGLVVLAVTGHPGGYSPKALPEVFFRVVARFI